MKGSENMYLMVSNNVRKFISSIRVFSRRSMDVGSVLFRVCVYIVVISVIIFIWEVMFIELIIIVVVLCLMILVFIIIVFRNDEFL